MKEDIYSRRSNLVIGFHGCDASVAQKVVNGEMMLKPSQNDYDWLGSGIYFWENNVERAFEFAVEQSKRKGSCIKTPAVLGAVIDLGFCMDLIDTAYLKEIRHSYEMLVALHQMNETPMPVNTKIGEGNDMVLRRLDCAVLELAHQSARLAGEPPFDSVKGAFWEGGELYPGAGFREKNHIQICVRNPNCIKGFFLPRPLDVSFSNP